MKKLKVQLLSNSKLPNVIPLYKREDGRPVYKTEETFTVMINKYMLAIPPGVEFDYASIPRMFWRLFLPNDIDTQAASLVHDVLYQAELFPREINDEIFKETLLVSGSSRTKASLMHFAVRMGGGFTYSAHSVSTINNVRSLLGLATDGCQRPYYNKEFLWLS